jgi:hypothetical protein
VASLERFHEKNPNHNLRRKADDCPCPGAGEGAEPTLRVQGGRSRESSLASSSPGAGTVGSSWEDFLEGGKVELGRKSSQHWGKGLTYSTPKAGAASSQLELIPLGSWEPSPWGLRSS